MKMVEKYGKLFPYVSDKCPIYTSWAGRFTWENSPGGFTGNERNEAPGRPFHGGPEAADRSGQAWPKGKEVRPKQKKTKN